MVHKYNIYILINYTHTISLSSNKRIQLKRSIKKINIKKKV